MADKDEGAKEYDLEERPLQFARAVRAYVKTLPRKIADAEDIRQLRAYPSPI